MEAQPSQQPTPPPLSSVSPHHSYPDSVDSSPRSRNTDSWDEPYPPPTSNKLRLMCSYGGHIVPRPHDRSLCYVGGDTRIVVVDRHTSLSDLSARLSKTFLNGNPFSLKYQLPSEDLDSLVSVTADEDLENMIDEYDHRTLSSSSSKPSRIRLFLFPAQPNSAQSIGPVQPGSARTKSEDWFVNALNTGRVLSDSSSVNCLLGLDDEVVAAVGNNSSSNNLNSSQPGNGKNLKLGQDVHSVPDSPMLETNSSFGSTSSLPSIGNLPPIRVHAEDGGGGGGGTREQDQKVVGIEEQFAQLGVGGVVQKQDEGFVAMSSQPQPAAAANVSVAASQSQTQTQPQYQALPPQFQQKSGGVVDLPSPDSVSSDRSLSNAMSRPIPVIYQDQVQIQSGTSRVPNTSVDPNLYVSDPHGRIQMQQHLQEHGYVLQQQFDQQQQQQQQEEAQQQQQFIHGTHLIHHTPSGPVPIPAYYPVYQQQLHPQHHHQLDQPYQVYYVPARQAQPYNLSMQQQANIGESATTISSSQPQNQPNPAPSAAYNPMRNAPLPKSEMTAGSYRTAAATPQFVQVPTGQHQQQYVAYSQIHHHPSQPMAPNSAAPANYAYDYADSAYGQIFYTQPLAPSMPSQYQTMTPAEVSAQLPSDSMKQQIRTSQPL